MGQMSPSTESAPYLLSYRSQNQEEDRRLDSQHDVITHAILGGHLIHPSIPLSAIQTSIADIACGTGIWLKDVRKAYFPASSREINGSPVLVGFDVNAHAFDPDFATTIKLIQHDCTKDFPSEYIGKFDLVNMRGLAYAVPKEGFSRLVFNAIKLLRPGGYLQWLETETRLFRQYPVSADFTEAIAAINTERQSRGLVTDMPQFMLRALLQQHIEQATNESVFRADTMSILHFNLLPGGICRDLGLRMDLMNRRLSETVLESVKLLLAASLRENHNGSQKGCSEAWSEEEAKKIHRLMDGIDTIMKSDEVIAGGIFPQLIAQKSIE